jgi:DNA-binding transcriptional LysR family regulator
VDLKQLSAFCTIAKTQSFTRAAAQLGYAQSTVTAQIQSLETALRAKVFERRNEATRLTPTGERLLPYAERILSLAEEARQAVGQHEKLFGRLSIGSAEAITSYRLPEIIEAFYHRYPGARLSLQIFHGGQDVLMRSVERGEIELALVTGTSVPAGPRTKYLWDEKVTLVAAPGHPLASQKAVTANDLKGEPIVVTQSECVYSQVLKSQVDADLSPSLDFGTLEAVKGAVAAGLGVSMLPWVAVEHAVKAGDLSVLAWESEVPIKTHAAWSAMSADSPLLGAFVSQLAQVGEQLLKS